MILPFITGRHSQLSVEMSYEKLFTQLFVHSVRLIVIAHNGVHCQKKSPKAKTKHS